MLNSLLYRFVSFGFTVGWNIMYEHGILPVSDGYSNDYNERTNNAILAEFTGAVFRHHSAVYGHINILDENYKVLNTEMLANTFNNPVILKNPDNFDGILRGYIYTPQRAVDKYYDHQVHVLTLKPSNLLQLQCSCSQEFYICNANR